MGTQNGHNVPFLESASLEKRKGSFMKRIKPFYKISKTSNKKKSCHLVPKVVIELPFERRKVEGSWKYRSNYNFFYFYFFIYLFIYLFIFFAKNRLGAERVK